MKGLRKMLVNHLEEKQIALFEKRKKGNRKQDRQHVQLIDAIDNLLRNKEKVRKRK